MRTPAPESAFQAVAPSQACTGPLPSEPGTPMDHTSRSPPTAMSVAGGGIVSQCQPPVLSMFTGAMRLRRVPIARFLNPSKRVPASFWKP